MHYAGIDLGTTNSAISYYDGVNQPQIRKSPEQNDVTPSAIYINKRGNRYYGYKAYTQASVDKKNSATLFKRYMGTNNKFEFQDSGVVMSPEECSAEILKVLYGYLPDDVRNDPETGTVITVPAAFNQVKKEATLEAANMAGIGRVSLMQEPAAAIMSVISSSDHNSDGIFLVYDLGGGTFDLSIAESINGKVNLLAQEGKEMCGGRDWDRRIFDNLVVSWLRDNFSLPDNFLADENYQTLRSAALFAVEQAKISLSSRSPSEAVMIQSDDFHCIDLKGREIYLDIPLSRNELNPLIDDLLDETIELSRAAMKKAGLSAADIERLVFIGGPTNYSYLRDKVSSELALKPDNSVNPMTAVAEGAAIFAESVDWSSENHSRKPSNADITLGTSLHFRYESRASGNKARVVCHVNTPAKLLCEITSDDTGWTSGRFELKDGVMLELPLLKEGDNNFTASVYDMYGRKIAVPIPKILITKTLASVGGIPASHSIFVPALDRLGGTERLVYLVRKDESLPKKGRVNFKAAQTLKAGTEESLNFNLYEGEIEQPYQDNRFVGVYKISGANLYGRDIIPAGSEIVCDYEISDGGTIAMFASVSCLGTEFERRNFYIHDDAKLDLNAERLADEGREIISRIDDMSEKIDDPRLDKARAKTEHAAAIDSEYISDNEEIQEAYNELHEAKNILSQIRKDHYREINQAQLDNCIEYFNRSVAQYADTSDTAAFNNLSRTAQRLVNDPGFERYIGELWGKISNILFRQDWFVIDYFKGMIQNPYSYHDSRRFNELKNQGLKYIEQGKINELRTLIFELSGIMKTVSGDDKQLIVNIIKG